MTTARHSTRGTAMMNTCDCGRQLTSKNTSEARATGHRDLCNDCFDYAGHENMHSDNGHDTILNLEQAELEDWMIMELPHMAHCRVCLEQTPAADAPREGTAPTTWSSHKGHAHPATAKARAACRKAARQG